MPIKRSPKKEVVKKFAKKKVQQPNIEVPPESIAVHTKPEDLAGSYSNFAVFKHTKREFWIDFLWRFENTNILVSRIITSPHMAKAIFDALDKNIKQYEKTHGKIKKD